ncbi:hypothetical protein EYF80_032333 [Liparis tanakae]|uniref:Uncharacterized protein n=1 Tax=Liparis tanakae TaxID=230148 RepID=A0A4Z2GWF6_9TELE|nr:hypothetical protein EYF80_032333 [Liparis tanakae]
MMIASLRTAARLRCAGKELYKSVHKGEEGGGREGGRKRRRGGIVSSHCSIKSVGNDQDEMMAIFLLQIGICGCLRNKGISERRGSFVAPVIEQQV